MDWGTISRAAEREAQKCATLRTSTAISLDSSINRKLAPYYSESPYSSLIADAQGKKIHENHIPLPNQGFTPSSYVPESSSPLISLIEDHTEKINKLQSEVTRASEERNLIESKINKEYSILSNDQKESEKKIINLLNEKITNQENQFRILTQVFPTKDNINLLLESHDEEILSKVDTKTKEVKEENLELKSTFEQFLLAFFDLSSTPNENLTISDDFSSVELSSSTIPLDNIFSMSKCGMKERLRKILFETMTSGFETQILKHMKTFETTLSNKFLNMMTEYQEKQWNQTNSMTEQVNKLERELNQVKTEFSQQNIDIQYLKANNQELRNEILTIQEHAKEEIKQAEKRSSLLKNMKEDEMKTILNKFDLLTDIVTKQKEDLIKQNENYLIILNNQKEYEERFNNNIKLYQKDYEENLFRIERWRNSYEKLKEEISHSHYLNQSNIVKEINAKFDEINSQLKINKELLNANHLDSIEKLKSKIAIENLEFSNELKLLRSHLDEKILLIQDRLSLKDSELNNKIQQIIQSDTRDIQQQQQLFTLKYDQINSELNKLSEKYEKLNDDHIKFLLDFDNKVSNSTEEKLKMYNKKIEDNVSMLDSKISNLENNFNNNNFIVNKLNIYEENEEKTKKLINSMNEKILLIENNIENYSKTYEINYNNNIERITQMKEDILNENNLLKSFFNDEINKFNNILLKNSHFYDNFSIDFQEFKKQTENFNDNITQYFNGLSEKVDNVEIKLEMKKQDEQNMFEILLEPFEDKLNDYEEKISQLHNKLIEIAKNDEENNKKTKEIEINLLSLTEKIKNNQEYDEKLGNIYNQIDEKLLANNNNLLKNIDEINEKFDSLAQQELFFSTLLTEYSEELEKIKDYFTNIDEKIMLNIKNNNKQMNNEINSFTSKYINKINDLIYEVSQSRNRLHIVENLLNHYSTTQSSSLLNMNEEISSVILSKNKNSFNNEETNENLIEYDGKNTNSSFILNFKDNFLNLQSRVNSVELDLIEVKDRLAQIGA